MIITIFDNCDEPVHLYWPRYRIGKYATLIMQSRVANNNEQNVFFLSGEKTIICKLGNKIEIFILSRHFLL